MRVIALSILAIAAATAGFALASGDRERPLPLNGAGREEQGTTRLHLTADERMRLHAEGLLPQETRSVLNVRQRLSHGDFVWDESNVPDGEVDVRIDLTTQLVSVYRAGHEIGTAVVTFGARGHDTPIGTLQVIGKFREHRSRTYGADMPYTLRLTEDGISIHASDVRWGKATHGCIGLPEDFARRLFDEVDLGQSVVIRASEQTT